MTTTPRRGLPATVPTVLQGSRKGRRIARAHRSVLRLLVAIPFMLISMTGVAWAYWTSSAAGTASASTGTINAPTAVAASNTTGTQVVSVSWTASAPAGGLSPSGYYVTRVRNSDSVTFAACGSSAASPTATTSCNDMSVPNGTFHYRVIAVRASWTATGGSSNDVSVVKDVTAPTVTINQASTQADPTNSGTVTFTAIFSETVTGFIPGDVTVTGTATGSKTVAISGAGPTYAVAISGMTGDGTIIATIGAGKVTDIGGNVNTASTSGDNIVTLDATRPGVTITQGGSQADPTSSGPITFTATFTETVADFAITDVTVGGTAGGTKNVAITGTGSIYTITITGMTGNGTITATIAAGTVTDAAGNTNTASTNTDNTVTLDTTKPGVTINQGSTQNDPTAIASVVFTATFTEMVTGFTSTDVTVAGTAGGSKTVAISGSGSTYTVTISGMTSNGTVTASIAAGKVTDAAFNSNTVSTSTDNTVTFARANVKAQYANMDTAPTDNWIRLGLQLVNTGSSGVDLSTITVRYWFTADTANPTFVEPNCWYAAIDCSNIERSVSGVTARTGANHTLLVGFKPSTLAAGGSTGVIELAFHKEDWSNFNEANDYSYGTGTSYADSTKVTVYQDGVLIWGTEP